MISASVIATVVAVCAFFLGLSIGFKRKGKVLVKETESRASIILGCIGQRVYYLYKNGNHAYVGTVVGYSERGFVFRLSVSEKRLEDKVLYCDLQDKRIQLNKLQPKTN